MLPIRYEDLDPDTMAIVEAMLPPRAREFVRLIGLRATLGLISEFGGTSFVLPKTEDGPAAATYAHIAGIVGHEQIKTLTAYFSSDVEVYVPMASKALAALRNRQLIEDWDELTKSMSGRRATNTLARRYRMSDTNVHVIVNGTRKSRAKSLEAAKEAP